MTWATVGAITGARANALRTISEIVMRGGRAWAGGKVTNHMSRARVGRRDDMTQG